MSTPFRREAICSVVDQEVVLTGNVAATSRLSFIEVEEKTCSHVDSCRSLYGSIDAIPRCLLHSITRLSALVPRAQDQKEGANMDDHSPRQPRGQSRYSDSIELEEVWQIRYWCDKWRVTEEELRAAVAAVGKNVKDVKRALNRFD